MDVRKQTVELRIGHVSSNHGGGYIAVELTDPVSGIMFASLEVPFKQFGSLVVNGPSERVPCELRGLENIGKKYVWEPRKVMCPLSGVEYSSRQDVFSRWLLENAQEEGWSISTYLGSRDAIQTAYSRDECRTEIGTWLKYNVYKYVDPETHSEGD